MTKTKIRIMIVVLLGLSCVAAPKSFSAGTGPCDKPWLQSSSCDENFDGSITVTDPAVKFGGEFLPVYFEGSYRFYDPPTDEEMIEMLLEISWSRIPCGLFCGLLYYNGSVNPEDGCSSRLLEILPKGETALNLDVKDEPNNRWRVDASLVKSKGFIKERFTYTYGNSSRSSTRHGDYATISSKFKSITCRKQDK